MPTAFRYAEAIEQSLDRLAGRCADPTPFVYDRLFAEQPNMRAHFWRDRDGAIRGAMLSRTFEALLDYVGERRYADHMFGTEMVTHEGYDIPRGVFATFFGVVAATIRDLLGPEWTPAMETAWRELLSEIDAILGATVRTDTSNSYFTALRERFEREYVAA